MIPFWLRELVKVVVLPPTGPLLVALFGLALMRRHPRAARFTATAGVVALALLAMPAISILLVRSLDDTPPLDMAKAREAQAIAILGGGIRPFASEYGRPTVAPLTLERVRYGAWLARATHLPVLLSGGSVRGGPPEALLMRDALVGEFGVPAEWIETRSRNTHENAVESAKVLVVHGVSRVILVGQSFDFPRTRKEFEAAGLAVVPAPIDIPRPGPVEVEDFVPSASGLLESYYACYEILANALFDVTHAFAPAAPVPAKPAPPVT